MRFLNAPKKLYYLLAFWALCVHYLCGLTVIQVPWILFTPLGLLFLRIKTWIWFALFTFSSKSSLLCYDYASSATLDEFLRNSRITLNLDVVLAVAIDVIYAIQCMEQKGVVHNNITTANVLIGRGLRVIFIYYNMLRTFEKCMIFFEFYVKISIVLFFVISWSQCTYYHLVMRKCDWELAYTGILHVHIQLHCNPKSQCSLAFYYLLILQTVQINLLSG